MTLEVLIILARLYCPWQPDPLPPTVILPNAVYEEVEERYGFDGSLGLTTWREDPVTGRPVAPLIYLREGSGDRVLCHEWGHAVDGHWHP